jgi:hypothetical protein
MINTISIWAQHGERYMWLISSLEIHPQKEDPMRDMPRKHALSGKRCGSLAPSDSDSRVQSVNRLVAVSL